MQTLFSTSDVHPRDRFDYWHDVASKTLVHHDSEPESRQDFRAELRAGALASTGLVLFENSPMTISVTARHAAHADTDPLFICRQLAGKLALEQGSREVVLAPADITLIDPRLPYAGTFFPGAQLLVLKLPRRALEARIGKTRELTARPIGSAEAESGLISAFLAMLPAHAAGLDATAAAIVEDKVLDLLAVSLARTMGHERPRVSSARSVVLMKLRAAIETRLTDPALDASTVAAAAGVSVRYANAVLADENTSIMRLILARRLARCRTALGDPSQAHRTVSEIAYGWGFSDMTHFGRRFVAAYGSMPREYRRRASENNCSAA
jgi:AraC-like DNA-binding protein